MREFIFREEETTIPVEGKMLVPYGELVRCKDCRYYTGDFCDYNDFIEPNSGEWFCANGERKENKGCQDS